MNRLAAAYWLLHAIGFAGLMASLLSLPMKLMPPYLLGMLGGAWLFACICLARYLAISRKTWAIKAFRKRPCS